MANTLDCYGSWTYCLVQTQKSLEPTAQDNIGLKNGMLIVLSFELLSKPPAFPRTNIIVMGSGAGPLATSMRFLFFVFHFLHCVFLPLITYASNT